MTRVRVFLDYQNVYKGAREVFGWEHHPDFCLGQVFPRRLGVLLTDRGRKVDAARQLDRVEVFRGEPSARHSPPGQAACQRQVRFWNAQTAVVATTRPLKYYSSGPREKGIDVLIALAMVLGAARDEYDVAVLFSGDTDLAPAVERVIDLGKRCEVASWQGRADQRSRLSVPGRNVWCHWLSKHDYGLVQDRMDYTQPQLTGPVPDP